MRLDVEPQREIETEHGVDTLPLHGRDQVEQVIQLLRVNVSGILPAVENGAVIANDIDS